MNRQICTAIPGPKAALVLLILSALLMGACGSRTCPPGTAQNATGDCVVVGSRVDGDSDPAPTDSDPVDTDTDDATDGDAVDDMETDLPPRTCTQDGHCRSGELCYFDVDGGLCLPPCTASTECMEYGSEFVCNVEGRCMIPDPDGGCDSHADCEVGNLCHIEASINGVCMIPCQDDTLCEAFSPTLECRSNNICAPPLAGNCTSDGDCPMGDVCHPALDGGTCAEACGDENLCPRYHICSAENRCVRDPLFPSCVTAADCESGTVCHQEAMDGGVCAPACTSDDDCDGSVREDMFCNALRRCVPQPVGSGCQNNADCPLQTICHRQLGDSGECHLPCESTEGCASLGDDLICANGGQCTPDPGDACGGDSDCEINTVCHYIDTSVETGVCAAVCASDSDCEALGADLFCNSESRCAVSGSGGCDSNADCPVNTVCHGEIMDGEYEGLCAAPCDGDTVCQSLGGANFFCNAAYQCRDGSAIAGCNRENDCPLGQVCHIQAIDGGVCAGACASSTDCEALGDELFCNGEQRCAPVVVSGCTYDTDCSGDDVCHQEMGTAGLCLPVCTASEQCPNDSLESYCNAEGRCRVSNGGGCYYDTDCEINTVCHNDAVAGGICQAACTTDDDCNIIGPGLYCNANERCVQDVQVDGDIDDVDEESDCIGFLPGETFDIDLRTSSLQMVFTYNGNPYLDPGLNSVVYLKDVDSGNQFYVAYDFEDGSALPAVTVLQGTYDVVFANHLGQRATVYENLELTEETHEISIPLPLVRIDFSISLNGAAYPALPPERRGELILYDTRKKVEYIAHGSVGDGDNDSSMYVFDSTYDVRFRGWLADQEDAYQDVTLLNDIRIPSDRTLPFDLETAIISGDITWKGGDLPDDADLQGWLWLINPLTDDRFPFKELTTAGAHSYSRPVIKDSYTVAYRPNLADSFPESFSDDAPTCLHAVSGDVAVTENTTLDLDINLAHLTGSITYRGETMPDHEFLHRGFVVAIDPVTEAICPMVDLGSNGAAPMDAYLAQGSYDLQFIGPLIDSERFADTNYPRSARQQIFNQGFEVTGDGDHTLDLPLLRMTGNLYVDGEGFSIQDGRNHYFTMRQKGTYDDVVSLDFNGWDGPGFVIDLFEGIYDIRFQGDLFTPGTMQYFKVADQIELVEDTQQDVELFFRNVSFVVTVNNVPLRQLLEDGVYTSVSMDATDRNTYARLTGSDDVDVENNLSFKRPDGTYDFIMRLYYDDTNYIDMPVFKREEISEDRVLNLDVPINTYRINVTLNGEPVPDDSGDNSRLDLIMRSSSDFYLNATWDGGATGAAEGIFRTKPDEYDVNLRTGYSSDVFDYAQWKSLGCFQFKP